MIEGSKAERLRAHGCLATVLALSFFLNLFPLWWGLPALDAWAFDEIRPAAVVEGLEQQFSDGWSGPYPPFHYYLLGALFWPVVWAGTRSRTGRARRAHSKATGKCITISFVCDKKYFLFGHRHDRHQDHCRNHRISHHASASHTI